MAQLTPNSATAQPKPNTTNSSLVLRLEARKTKRVTKI